MSDIDNLTPDQLEAISRLINKFNRQNAKEEPQEQKGGRTKSKKRIIVEGDEDYSMKPPTKNKTGRKKPKNPQSRRKQSGRRREPPTRPGKSPRKGRQAVTQSVQLSGENLFETMQERKSCKKDAKIDQALWKDRTPEIRRDEVGYIEVECQSCGLYFDVLPSEVFKEDGEYIYTCNSCAASRRG